MMDVTVLDKPLWLWAAFFVCVLVLVVFDLGVLQRGGPKEISIRRSLHLSAFYIACGLLFGVFVWAELGRQSADEYFTGFIIEKSLSLDNIFVISLVFSYFAIPRMHQYRVLFWGIIGVIILRGLMIGAGTELVRDYHWVLYIFAVFLVFSGVKMLMKNDDKPDIATNPVLKFLKNNIRFTDELHGKKFLVRLASGQGKKQLHATRLLLCLIVIEFVDLIFAVDSVPAVFAVTTDTYVVYTSNVFAILGLRALYFSLSAMLHRFQYLDYSLAAVLIFIGGKVLAVDLLGMEKFPASLSLGITLSLLAAGVFYSLWKTKQNVQSD